MFGKFPPFLKIVIVPLMVIMLFGCEIKLPEDSPVYTKTVAGTILVQASGVKIGAFSKDYSFGINIFATGQGDVIVKQGSSVGGSFVPLSAVSPAADGTYSFDLPEDPTVMGQLVAWVDVNGDEKYDLGSEPGYLPVKVIFGLERVVLGFTYFNAEDIGGSGPAYLVQYQDEDGALSYSGFDILTPEGFNFRVD